MFRLLFPPFCVSCQKLTSSYSPFYRYLCPSCFEKIRLREENFCPGCHRPGPLGKTCSRCRNKIALRGLVVAACYQNPILKETLHTFKYKGVKDLSWPLSWLLAKKLAEFPWQKKEAWILVPVPLTKRRQRKRGFNQAEILAQNLGKMLNISIFPDIMERVHFFRPQAEIQNQEERKKNVKNAFSLNPAFSPLDLKNKKIMLVDDVATTGATLNECAKVLKPYAKKIWGCVVAK